MRSSQLFALAAAVPSTLAAYKGFNYGATNLDGSIRSSADFEAQFNAAKNLVGTDGTFTSARLYTSIQGGTTNTPSSAFEAALNTGTSMLLGVWASGGQTQLNNEIAAIQSAISQYGSSFTSLIAGISVGSEDCYRITDLGIESGAGAGATPDTITNYIGQVKSAFPNLGKPVGHVDTYNTWSNSSGWMSGTAAAADFIGIDAYPYFESTKPNSIGNANSTFWADYSATADAVSGKPIWITETGWPTSGPTMNEAVPSVDNAKTYFEDVGCSAFSAGINTWYYTLQDADTDASVPSFGVVSGTGAPGTSPKYSLAC